MKLPEAFFQEGEGKMIKFMHLIDQISWCSVTMKEIKSLNGCVIPACERSMQNSGSLE